MQLTGQNYIAGETSAEGAGVFYSIDPRSKATATFAVSQCDTRRGRPRGCGCGGRVSRGAQLLVQPYC